MTQSLHSAVRDVQQRDRRYTFRMIIQTNPEAFSNRLPVHTVTNIDRLTGIVILSGSDGTQHEVRLDSWGPLKETQPVVGSKVQVLPDEK